MSSRELFIAKNGWIDKLITNLSAEGTKIIAPCRQNGNVLFGEVTSAGEVVLDTINTTLPLKELFFPRTERLLSYEQLPDGSINLQSASPEEDTRVVLGARPCDAAALERLDKIFSWDYEDIFYRARRDNTTVITFACSSPEDKCFCTTVGGGPQDEAGSDVLAIPFSDDRHIVRAVTDKGKALVEKLSDVFKPADSGVDVPTAPDVPKKFDLEKIKPWLDENFDNKFFLDVSLKCLGCGACSYMCPTCHCFDIVDESTWKAGERRRNWDCCSFALFTLHASGHNPRPTQQTRVRQRLMHKFKYFPERFGMHACVGCGRCIRHCAAGQNVANVLARISEGDVPELVSSEESSSQ